MSVGYQYVRGRHLLMSINQNVPSCVAAGTNNGCRPNPTYANNSQYSSVGDSNYHGLHLSFLQRPVHWGQYRVSYTLSKSMNNLGEFFFSSPIDPFDLSKDWGRSDDDQRHRLVFNGPMQTSMAPATTAWQYVTHGFQLSGLLQTLLVRRRSTSHRESPRSRATAGRPIVNGEFIPRNAGVGSRFLQPERAHQPIVPRVGQPARSRRSSEGFNLTNHRNVVTRNANFGAGSYPTSPSPTFNQITAVSEPRSFQFGARVRF